MSRTGYDAFILEEASNELSGLKSRVRGSLSTMQKTSGVRIPLLPRYEKFDHLDQSEGRLC